MTLLATQQTYWEEGIRFDTNNESVSYLFEEPRSLSFWTPPKGGGIYAILLYDPKWKPKPYRVIYFGQTEDFCRRGFPKQHEKYEDWLRQANTSASSEFGDLNLYIAIMQMPYSTEAERENTEKVLIKKHNPVCNVQHTGGLFSFR